MFLFYVPWQTSTTESTLWDASGVRNLRILFCCFLLFCLDYQYHLFFVRILLSCLQDPWDQTSCLLFFITLLMPVKFSMVSLNKLPLICTSCILAMEQRCLSDGELLDKDLVHKAPVHQSLQGSLKMAC